MNLIWKVRRVAAQGDDEVLNQALADHWEPFAVTRLSSSGGYMYHLRRLERIPRG